jgi:hypothetical protein
MIATKPDFAIAIHRDLARSKGTKDCVKQALAAGLRVYLFDHETGNGRRIKAEDPRLAWKAWAQQKTRQRVPGGSWVFIVRYRWSRSAVPPVERVRRGLIASRWQSGSSKTSRILVSSQIGRWADPVVEIWIIKDFERPFNDRFHKVEVEIAARSDDFILFDLTKPIAFRDGRLIKPWQIHDRRGKVLRSSL